MPGKAESKFLPWDFREQSQYLAEQAQRASCLCLPGEGKQPSLSPLSENPPNSRPGSIWGVTVVFPKQRLKVVSNLAGFSLVASEQG